MSKLDAQRAMREAKYARNRASGPTRREAAAAGATGAGETPPVPAVRTPAKKPARAAASASVAASGTEERCGHKSMNGRACTREANHSEKSHRYS